MPERLNGAVSKTVEQATAPGVRIPLSPPRENARARDGATRRRGEKHGGAREVTPIALTIEGPVLSSEAHRRATLRGEMRERSNRRDWKSRGRETVPRVRIPLSPPRDNARAGDGATRRRGERPEPDGPVSPGAASCSSSPCRPVAASPFRNRWGCSSVGRALPSQGRGRRFDPAHLHQPLMTTPRRQRSVRGPTGGRGPKRPAPFSSGSNRCRGSSSRNLQTVSDGDRNPGRRILRSA